mgnify:CR=1 FL=1
MRLEADGDLHVDGDVVAYSTTTASDIALKENINPIDNALDKVIQLIRQADDVDSARKSLMAELNLTEPQSQAILDMQLRRLAALERQRLEDEYKNVINLSLIHI